MSYYNPMSDQQVMVAPVERRLDMQAIMRWVYVWMTFGLVTTAITSAITLSVDSLTALLLENPAVLIIAFVVEIGLVIALGAGIRRFSPSTSALLFFIYSAINGFTLSLLLYFAITFVEGGTGMIFTAFATTAALFGAMTLLGLTTKIDLTKMGSYLMMGVIGLLIAMVINMFMQSSGLDLLISFGGVIIFTGLAAYDTQKIQRMAADPAIQSDGNLAMKISIMGALTLYLDFINLFIFILRLLMALGRD